MPNPLSGLFDQIENFLFDLLGIALPGFILLLLIGTPIIIASFPSSIVDFSDSSIRSNYMSLNHWFSNQPLSNSFYFILLISFIIGHVVKVLSKVWYELLTAVFDDTVNILFVKIITKVGITKERFNSKKGINPLLYALSKQLATIFTFRSQSYYKENENLKKESIKNFNSHFKTNFSEEVWYSVYKLSKIVNTHESIKSLSYTYLAKYNFYRSLAFIFAFNLIYELIFIQLLSSNGVVNLTALVLIINLVFWFTFHEKYKRYWTLCGDETLMAFYYFTLRKKEKE